jgi:hypothetical protein
VGEFGERDQHLPGLETLLVALGRAEPLLTPLKVVSTPPLRRS